MRIEQVIQVIEMVLKDMKSGEIRIIVRGGEVKHINTVQEVKPCGIIEESEKF